MNDRPRRVLHAVNIFLERTEVFIYRYITSHRDFSPSVLTCIRSNPGEFPFEPVHEIWSPISKREPAWWLARAAEALTGRAPWHRRVARALSAIAPDVIHAHFGHFGYQVMPIRRTRRPPLVVTFYGYDLSVLPRRRGWPERYRHLFAQADLFLAEGPHMRDTLLALGAPASKTRVQPITVAVDEYPRWRPSAGPARILFVGRFTEKKGLAPLLEAAAPILRSRRDVSLRLIGDGEGRVDAESRVRRLGIESQVEFLGMQPHRRVVEELAAAKVFAQPSRTAANGDSEGGAPTVLLEAQCVGVPIVATRHADIPNVVAPGDPGVILVDEYRDDALGAALEAALAIERPVSAEFVRRHHDVAPSVRLLESRYAALIDGAEVP